MGSTPIDVQVVGRLDSAIFQRAKSIAETLGSTVARDVTSTVTTLTEFDWDIYLSDLIQQKGTSAKKLVEPVVVTVDGVIQESVSYFSRWAGETFKIEFSRGSTAFNDVAAAAHKDYLANEDKSFVYFDMLINDKAAGRMVFELYKNTCPKTVKNFEQLASGEAGENENGIKLHYEGSVIHRVQEDGWIQGGDIITGAGDGGESIYGKTFPDENFIVQHDGRGILSMANNGINSNRYVIFICPCVLVAVFILVTKCNDQNNAESLHFNEVEFLHSHI
eukprot:m.384495 g.384495  ORF g.384495 m.384495 type:complete len:277 (+) comp20995_c0_seq2:221-1051(+)